MYLKGYVFLQYDMQIPCAQQRAAKRLLVETLVEQQVAYELRGPLQRETLKFHDSFMGQTSWMSFPHAFELVQTEMHLRESRNCLTVSSDTLNKRKPQYFQSKLTLPYCHYRSSTTLVIKKTEKSVLHLMFTPIDFKSLLFYYAAFCLVLWQMSHSLKESEQGSCKDEQICVNKCDFAHLKQNPEKQSSVTEGKELIK